MMHRRHPLALLLALCVLCIPLWTHGAVGAEKDYNAALAIKYAARQQVATGEGSVVDLVTDTEAIEIDFSRHWQEAIGQSLFYGLCLKKSPAIILIVGPGPREAKYVARCKQVCDKYQIHLYVEPRR